jgi:hypothetical protein
MIRHSTFRLAVAVLAVSAAVAAGAAGPLAASGERSFPQQLASPGQPWPEPYEDDPPSPPGDEDDPPRPVSPGCPNCFI